MNLVHEAAARQDEVALAGVGYAVEVATEELRRGRAILVVDEEHRERGGNLLMAAQQVSAAALAMMARRTTGMPRVALPASRADELGLSPGARSAVSVDCRSETTAGLSIVNRAQTVRVLADPGAGPRDFAQPGHVFVARAREGGLLRCHGQAEGAVDLCRLAGLVPVGVLAEVADDNGGVVRWPRLAGYAAEWGVVTVTLGDIADHRLASDDLLRRDAAARIPTEHGVFTAITYHSLIDDTEQVALVFGDLDRSAERPVPVHVHAECLIGDVFGSRRCGCAERLHAAMAAIAAAGGGVVIYLRAREGGAGGLLRQLRGSAEQDSLVSEPPMGRLEYGICGQILHDLDIHYVGLNTADAAIGDGLRAQGLQVAPVTGMP